MHDQVYLESGYQFQRGFRCWLVVARMVVKVRGQPTAVSQPDISTVITGGKAEAKREQAT